MTSCERLYFQWGQWTPSLTLLPKEGGYSLELCYLLSNVFDGVIFTSSYAVCEVKSNLCLDIFLTFSFRLQSEGCKMHEINSYSIKFAFALDSINTLDSIEHSRRQQTTRLMINIFFYVFQMCNELWHQMEQPRENHNERALPKLFGS